MDPSSLLMSWSLERRVRENGARALVPTWDVFLGGSRGWAHTKAGAAGCLEQACFGDQIYCAVPLLVEMQGWNQAGLWRMPIVCGHKSVRTPWE